MAILDLQAAVRNVIGTDVQAWDAFLTSIAALGTAADKMLYTIGVDTAAETALTSFGRSLIDDANAAAGRTTLGLGTIATINDAPSDGTTYGRLNGAWANAGDTHPIADTQTIIEGSVDATKLMRFENDTLITAGNTRVMTVPDVDQVLAGRNVNNLFSAAQTFNGDVLFGNDLLISVSNSPDNSSNPVIRSNGSYLVISAEEGDDLYLQTDQADATSRIRMNGVFDARTTNGSYEFGADFFEFKRTKADGRYGYLQWLDSADSRGAYMGWGSSGNYFQLTMDNGNDLAITGGNVIIGGTSANAQLHVDQASTTAAQPVLLLDQADVDQDMIEFATTIGVGNAIEAVGVKSLTTTHFIKVTLPGGLTRYIPVGTIA